MDRFLAWWKTARWAALAALGFVAVIAGAVLRGLFASKVNTGQYELPRPPTDMQNKVDKAKEEADLARARAQAYAENDHKDLDNIAKIPDDTERLQKLADKLKSL